MAKKLGIIENGNLDPYASLNGSKHIIRDASGAKPDENLLEFSNGLDVTDDPTNGKTIVAPNKSLVRQNEIASYILDGDKPSTALSSGTFFVDKNGLLRVANTNISTTDDVTDNNSSVKPIGDVLTELNSKTIGTWVNIPAQTVSTEISIYGSNQFRTSAYIVRGGLCFVNLAIHVNIDIGDNSIVVLPDGVLPKPLIPNVTQATFKPPAWSSFGTPNNQLFAESLYQGNVLYIRKAVAEDYAISFVYPVANP